MKPLANPKAVDICRANEVTQSHMKVLHEEAKVAVNKITRTKSDSRISSTQRKRKNARDVVMYMSQGSVQHMATFLMSARGRTILAACAKHQNKKENLENWRKKSMK